MTKLMRSEVPLEQRWNLAHLFASEAAWEEEIAAIEADLAEVTQFHGSLKDGSDRLLACLTAYEALSGRLVRAFTYAELRLVEDGTDPANQAAYAKAQSLQAKTGAALAFVQPEILSLPQGVIEQYLAAEPGLATYRKYLTEILARQPHTLQQETESCLAALGEVMTAPYTVYQRAKTADMTFEPIHVGDAALPVTFSGYEESLEGAADAPTRRAAFRSFTQGLSRYENTLAATFATEIKKNIVMARLRGYGSAVEMFLQPQQVDLGLYHRLHDLILAEAAPPMRRYARLRKRVLGLDRLLYCDIEAPLDPDYSPQITFEEAARIIVESLAVMGAEYQGIIHTALTERWVDWSANVGKMSGAGCASPHGAHSYIVISWADKMRQLLMLAHELGHAAHLTMANREQSLLVAEPSLFFAEGPSILNELLVGQHLMWQTQEPRLKRWVIMQLLSTYHHNFVRHLIEAELQRRVYGLAEKGEPITAGVLSATQGQILAEFWDGEVEVDEGARLTWMRQPHYYLGLYPYTYSAGLTAATAAARAIQNEGQPAVDRWLRSLKAGGSLSPLELMQVSGIDMRSPDPIRTAVAYLSSLVTQLEESF